MDEAIFKVHTSLSTRYIHHYPPSPWITPGSKSCVTQSQIARIAGLLTEQFQCLHKYPVLCLITPPSLQPLGHPDIFIVSVVLPFAIWLEFYVVFFVFFHLGHGFEVPPCLCMIDSSFPLSIECCSTIWKHRSWLIHPPAEGHLGCVLILAMMNKAAVNIHV